MEYLTLSGFCAILIGCLAADVSMVAALLAGLLLFLFYGKRKGFSFRALGRMCLSGIRTVGGILITFLLIGMLTASWRISGCIPAIVCYASDLIRPSVFVLLTFLLNAGVSMLTGTAFGTSATMGVICISIAQAMGFPLFWFGGAVLAGAFFGDRCSPVSTSALLVATLTETDIYRNIRGMLKTSLVPFLAACAVYAAAGLSLRGSAVPPDIRKLFSEAFLIHPLCLIPAGTILLLACFRAKVKPMMAVSIAVSVPVALLVEEVPVGTLLQTMLTGYRAPSETLGAMLNGGGILSMLRVAAIVCIAACYSGIFRETGLLAFLSDGIRRLADRVGVYPAVLLVSVPVAAVSCNQTLAIILTDQLTGALENDRSSLALDLEDSAVVVSPLIPWSIAATVPLATVGAPILCILSACYLYLLPLWRWLLTVRARKRAVSR